LPEGYDAAAKEQKALIRCRGVKNAGDLMMLALFHLLKSLFNIFTKACSHHIMA
jgi:hypothetical protein